MEHTIMTAALIPLRWNDDENAWELAIDQVGGALVEADRHPFGEHGCNGVDCDNQEHDDLWCRAVAASLPTADDLAHMLRSGLVMTMPRLEGDTNRQPSQALIDMVHAAIEDSVPEADHQVIRKIISRLIPIFGSVDQNAHLRGVHEGRASDPVAPVDADLRGKIRSAISNAYYDARNIGKTMDWAAEKATTMVIAVLDGPADTAGPVLCTAYYTDGPHASDACGLPADHWPTPHSWEA